MQLKNKETGKHLLTKRKKERKERRKERREGGREEGRKEKEGRREELKKRPTNRPADQPRDGRINKYGERKNVYCGYYLQLVAISILSRVALLFLRTLSFAS